MSAIIYDATPDHAIASLADVFIIVWRNRTTTAGVRASHRGWERFLGAQPKAAGLVTVVEQNAPLPPPEVRQGIADFLASLAPTVKASALVHEGEGFRAAAVRGVVTGLTLLATVPYPHRVFANVDEGAKWMFLDGGFRSAKIGSAIELSQEIKRMRVELERTVPPDRG